MSAGTYSQHFDSLPAVASAWTNNVTLPGWYASKGGADTTNLLAGSGASFTGGLYSFGDGADRALGSLASSSTTYTFGVRLLNDTEFNQTNITIAFAGEQWRSGSIAGAQTLAFSYCLGNGPLTNTHSSGWTSFEALDFESPNITGTAAALDGNAAGNHSVVTNVVLARVVIRPGQEILLRWLDVDDGGFDSALAIDDLTISFEAAPTNNLSPADTNAALLLLTYNVKGNGASDWSTNSPQVQAIGREVRYLQPDIITFQEIPFDLSYEMTNFVSAFLPGYSLARNSGTDGSIRSVIASRFPIARSKSWLDGVDLRSFGYSNANNALDNFTRDLFEAEIVVPDFPRPLHVFTTHLKSSGSDYTEAAAKRAAEAAAITNFIATNLCALHPLDPYVLTGDLNEANTNALAIQTLLAAPTGLELTNPKNPFTGSINTFSIQGSLSQRIDFIFPNRLLSGNILDAEVFRTDALSPLPPELNVDDESTASDHLPVLMRFRNPYQQPFAIVSAEANADALLLKWSSVPGQTYTVESSSNLTQWMPIETNLLATNGLIFREIQSSDSRLFLRVRQGQ